MKTRLFKKALDLLRLARDVDYQVLDFGCGKGDFLKLLSTEVGTRSRLVGYDAMEKSIASARTSLPNAEFVCDRFVRELPFPDASFDVIVTIDTIECIKGKEALINEIHRILKPGGQVLAMHWDWDTQTFNIPNRDVARNAVRAFSDWQQPWMDAADGQMGRKLWGLFEGSGKFRGTPNAFCLIETEYRAGSYGYERVQDLSALVTAGGFEQGQYEQFCRELSESSAKREYFYSVTSFSYHGWRG